jgi:uncharacterized protein (TIRG00374 family)
MKNAFKNSITAIFLVLGIIGMAVILKNYSIREIISFYANFDLFLLILYIMVLVLLVLTLTWRWIQIVRSRKINIPFKRLLVYRMIGSAINFFTPGPSVGGEPTQATLMTKHGTEFTEGLSTIMIDKIIDTSTSGILFMIGIFLVIMKYSFPKNTEIAVIIGGVLFLTIVILFYYRMLHNKHFFLHIFKFVIFRNTKSPTIKKLEKNIIRIERIMINFYSHDKKAFLTTIIISILSWLLMFFEYALATRLLGIDVGIVELFCIISFVGLAILFPIPMAVGVLEAGQISAFAIIGLNASAGVALAFLVRMKDIVFSIIGLVLLAAYGFRVDKIVEKKYEDKGIRLPILRNKTRNKMKNIKRNI